MHGLKTFICLVLLVTTPGILIYPQHISSHADVQIQQINYKEKKSDYIPSYDNMLYLLNQIESDSLESKCTPEELEKIIRFIAFLAQEGALPDHSEESLSLCDDIEALLNGKDNIYEDTISFAIPNMYGYMVTTTLLYEHKEAIFCKSWLKKQWKHVTKFTKKHKKALIIGAAIVVAAAAAVVAVSVAASAAAGAAVIAGSTDSHHSSKENAREEDLSSVVLPTDISSKIEGASEFPILKSAIDNQIYFFKENILQNQFFSSINPSEQQSLSWEENGRALGSLLAHDSYNNIQNELSRYPSLAKEAQDIYLKYTFLIPEGDQGSITGHPEIDRKFSTDYGYLYANPSQNLDFNILSYQVRGEMALSLGYYDQAIQDLGKVIEASPSNPLPYLERGIAHFGLGQYDDSLDDYNRFASETQKTHPISVSEFSVGFAKGLPLGVYESGAALFLFMTDFVKHPIQTSGHVIDSVSALVNLAREDEWEMIAEVLSPELYQLVTQWDVLSSEQRGELTGYAVGKHGADILAPGAIAKVASKSIKSAQELASIYRQFQIAQETLILETAAEIGSGSKIAEVIRSGQTTTALGKEMGFTAREMAQLQQSGKLQGAIDHAFDNLINNPSCEFIKSAINEDKHVKFIIDYCEKPIKEVKKSIASLDKQIAIHQEKITNPSKFIPDWENLHPERKNALINKKWPSEIQCYTEQKNILQDILQYRGE